MMSESMVRGRRNTVLAAVIGSVLAGYAGSAAALEFEFDNGAKLNWNTTLSVPIMVGPWITTCGPMRVRAPISTPSLITE